MQNPFAILRRAAAAFALGLCIAMALPVAAANAQTPEEVQALEDLGAQPNLDGRYEQGAYEDVADVPPDVYMRGVIESVEERRESLGEGFDFTLKTYSVRVEEGTDKGKSVTVESNQLDATRQNRNFARGDRVVLVKSYQDAATANYYIVDDYRMPSLLWIAAIFFGVAVLFGRKRGFTSALGLGVTVAVIIGFVVPQIAAGRSPLVTCVIAAFGIAAVALFLSHGFNGRTTLAFIGTAVSLAISVGLAVAYVHWARLFGTGSDDVSFLQGMGYADLDLRGLLLGGIILGVLGILDDVTTAQAAVVEELKSANPAFRFRDLYKRGISVGKEHIASLINTLFLAYAGASLPLFLLFSAAHGQPLWLVVNSEMIAEELVRTLVGSTGLILAVPITTALAALWYDKRQPPAHLHGGGHSHAHGHHFDDERV